MAVKHIKLYTIVALIGIVVIGLFMWFGRSKPVKVIVGRAEYGQVRDTVANTRAGTIKACRRAGISPSIGGQIDSLPVKEGDVVKAGQLLMALWNDDLRAQLALATSEAESSTATAEQVCVLADVARREARRQKQLQAKNLASEEAIDKAEGEARAQQAACTAARATTEVSKARVDVAQAALGRTRLVAPFPGIVAEVNGEVGEFVTPSPVGIPTPPAVDLMDISCLYVSAPIDEVDAPQIRVGMPANISLDAFAKKIFPGKVRRVAPYVLEMEKQARTVDVEVDFACASDCQNMLPGYSADIEVILQEHERALRIPTEAILEGNKVLLINGDGRLEEHEIETGLSNWAWTEVTKGLAEGDEVVVSVDRDGVEVGATVVKDNSASENND
jgi:HlyD family secretion protein